MSSERLKLLIPALLWAAIIFTVSSIPNLKTPSLDFKAMDKIAHFAEYFILGLFLAFGLNKMNIGKGKVFWISACAAGLYGILDEIHQLIVPGRVTDGFDMLADTIGAFAASGFYVLKMRKKQI